ncbi:MAG: hypothetical protein RLZZ468_435, partial [Cyanobacteriota bacterium]
MSAYPLAAAVGSAWDVAPAVPLPQHPAVLLPQHRAELEASAIAPDVAAANVVSFGGGTGRHWEDERAELIRYACERAANEQPERAKRPRGWFGRMPSRRSPFPDRRALDRRYRHLAGGGWRSLSATLPGLPTFGQWKPDQPRQRADKPGKALKYESPPAFPEGGGLLLPHVPERCWRLICQRQRLPFPSDPATLAAGFWAWALATPSLSLLICEGWKKALCALSHGYAAVAIPGVQMGRRVDADSSERLIPALAALSAKKRPWLIAFDAEGRRDTAAKVWAAAGALARTLRAAGGRPEIARLPLLPGTEKTGLDDLAAAAGPEALAQALADTAPRPVLPSLRAADHIAPAGFLGKVCSLPTPAEAPLLLIQAPMGCGKTTAIAAAVAPLRDAGVPVLLPSHRVAIGQAVAKDLGIAWAPRPGTDERQLGAGFCLDSACPSSALQISGYSWSGAVLFWDEIAQGLEHLLLSTGTALAPHRGAALAPRRAEVLRTLPDLLARAGQVIAADAQLPQWALSLLERLTGRRAFLIRSEHRPMLGRPLHAPRFSTAKAAAEGFRARWAELVQRGEPFLCWTAAQQARYSNSPQTLAALHRQWAPDARLAVIDSSTPELAAELAADPDKFAKRFDAIYCSPSISSGVSFRTWKPAAVIAYAGGHIAPEHAAQALARVRCPEVPAYLYAPERCPGAALRVGSGDTDPARVVAALRAVSDPLLGLLEEAGADGAWLEAYGELAAHRNRQRHAYRATIAGLLEREGWAIQPEGAEPCPVLGARAGADLKALAADALAAADAAVIAAPLLEPTAAEALSRRRKLDPAEQAALDRFRIAQRWALGGAAPSPELLEADRDGLHKRLQLGWLLTSPEARALIPAHDAAAVAALDRRGRPFCPDRLRVALAPRVAALQALGMPQLLARFRAGEVIAGTDPAVLALHATATAHRSQLAAAAGVSPGKLPTGTLRALLEAIGWQLLSAGRIWTRGEHRNAMAYRAEPVALPQGADWEGLAAAWLEELAAVAGAAGSLFAPIDNPCMGRKRATLPPPLQLWPPPPWAPRSSARGVPPP